MKTVVVKRFGEAYYISLEALRDLRMLADWQLSQLGLDPLEITQACLDVDEPDMSKPENWKPGMKIRKKGIELPQYICTLLAPVFNGYAWIKCIHGSVPFTENVCNLEPLKDQTS